VTVDCSILLPQACERFRGWAPCAGTSGDHQVDTPSGVFAAASKRLAARGRMPEASAYPDYFNRASPRARWLKAVASCWPNTLLFDPITTTATFQNQEPVADYHPRR
jgi:hypothetical protein